VKRFLKGIQDLPSFADDDGLNDSKDMKNSSSFVNDDASTSIVASSSSFVSYSEQNNGTSSSFNQNNSSVNTSSYFASDSHRSSSVIDQKKVGSTNTTTNTTSVKLLPSTNGSRKSSIVSADVASSYMSYSDEHRSASATSAEYDDDDMDDESFISASDHQMNDETNSLGRSQQAYSPIHEYFASNESVDDNDGGSKQQSTASHNDGDGDNFELDTSFISRKASLEETSLGTVDEMSHFTTHSRPPRNGVFSPYQSVENSHTSRTGASGTTSKKKSEKSLYLDQESVAGGSTLSYIPGSQSSYTSSGHYNDEEGSSMLQDSVGGSSVTGRVSVSGSVSVSIENKTLQSQSSSSVYDNENDNIDDDDDGYDDQRSLSVSVLSHNDNEESSQPNSNSTSNTQDYKNRG